ncbi:MAG: DNA-protecting protein DprA [Bacteroidia bacterium]|nr:DNA-protecting protein DprA [Bacteroidia bacterium]
MKTTLKFEIALQLLEGVGDVLAKYLVGYCGSAEAVFKQKKHALIKIPGIGPVTAEAIVNFKKHQLVEDEISFIEKHKIRPLFYLDSDYPFRLKNYDDSPVMLYYKGDADLNNTRIISVVGTRRPTPYGKAFCDELAEKLTASGCLIISGLAHGIDTHIHKAAIKNTIPTVGVLGHGLGMIYPAANKLLAKEMIGNGGLLTEFMNSSASGPENFPKRNRIVAGICDALVVVESAVTGGSLITAEIANSYNKDVYALPGRTTDLYSQGCNRLVQQNKAAIIETVEGLLKEIGWNEETGKEKKSAQKELFINLSEKEKQLVDYLSTGTKGIDDIHYGTGIGVSQLAMLLLDLEFKGLISTMPGKMYGLCR